MRSKTSLVILAALLVSALLITSCSKPQQAAPTAPASPAAPKEEKPKAKLHIVYGGSTVGGAANLIAIGHSRVWNNKVPGIEVTVEATSGGVDNVKLVNTAELHIGSGSSLMPYQGYFGTGVFKDKKQENVRGLLPLYELPMNVVVLKNSPVKTLEDLKGKRVSVGLKGSGSEAMVAEIMNSAGVKYETFKPYFIAYKETLDGLKDGSLDAGIFVTGAPVPAMMELAATHPFRIIPLTDEHFAKVAKDFKYYSQGVVAAGTYPGVSEPVKTIVSYSTVWINKDVPEDVVYQMVKTAWESRDEMIAAHLSQKHLTGEMVKNSLVLPGVPVHPGAAKYYKEKGFIQ